MYPDPINPITPDLAGVFGIVAAVVVIGLIVSMAIRLRNASKAVQAGQNPLTVEYDLALKALSSEALAAPRSTEDKLAEIERLFAEHAITADEREAARLRILGSL